MKALRVIEHDNENDDDDVDEILGENTQKVRDTKSLFNLLYAMKSHEQQ